MNAPEPRREQWPAHLANATLLTLLLLTHMFGGLL